MDKKDMTLLIEAEDAINDMDRLLVQLTSMGHSDGLFNKIDNVYEVIMNNSHEYYQKAKKENNDKIESLLYREQSGVIGEGPGGHTADRERKGRIKC